AALVRRRGEELRLWHDPLGSAARPALDLPEPPDIREAPLALSPLPPPIGVRPFVMRVVRRFTRWQLDPLVRYVNALRDEVLGTTDGDDPPAYH
ncbi:MAG: hypothetical protein ACRDYY_07235, partial [Acidimicrobiales bacterium]